MEPTSRTTQATTPTAGHRWHYAYFIVLLGVVSIFAAHGFTRFGYNMLLPGIRETLGFGFSEQGLLATANFGLYAVASAFSGWFVKKLGYRTTIAIGVFAVAVGLFLTGLSSSYWTILGLQMIAGIGSGLVVGPASTLASAWVTPNYRGMATGIITAGGPIGSIFTGVFLPIFNSGLGSSAWRYAWCAFGILVLAIAVLEIAFLRDDPRDKGLTPLGSQASTMPVKPSDVAGSPKVSVYRMPVVWQLGILSLLSTLAATSFNTFFSTYLIKDHGVDLATTGFLWSVTGMTGIASGFIWGSISDRISRKYAFMGSFAIQAVIFALFAGGDQVWIFALCGFVYGLTARSAFAVTVAFCSDVLTGHAAASAAGLTIFFAGAGQTLSPYIAGFIADVTPSFALAFWISAGIAAIGAVGSLLLPASRQQKAPIQITPPNPEST